MGTRDPRVDAYIEKQKEYAQPILEHIRALVHSMCPDTEESIKWGCPFFMYAGAPMCQMAAFREHAALGFWKAALIEGIPPNSNNGGESAGNFGRLKTVKDVPSKKVLAPLIKAAMKLNDDGVVVPKNRNAPKPDIAMPNELRLALDSNKKARTAFEAFPPSHRREYVEWIAEGKREETRAKRVAQAVEWIAEGKSRNWKHQGS
ncbi:MAG: YdeI/OmpD-associated family protein [Gemmatimonadota bacterium]|nr:YdeI/OmpD-associated family protein [Gemmatimonadota bacterium]